MKSERWVEISPSSFPWEREALTYVRDRLPDHEPYRVWSNFELTAGDGSIYEVDLLVLTPKGFFLVEIKSRPGILDGDAATWTWRHDGKLYTADNPLILTNRKAKKLADLLRRQRAMHKVALPFLEPLVFLSAEDIRVRLPDNVRLRVHTRDVEGAGERRGHPGIVAALTRWTADNPPRRRIDRPTAKALTQAMEQAGIRPSVRARRVGDYRLDALLLEGPAYQDWAATHVALDNDRARVRIYVVEPGASAERRESVERAARREYQLLSGVSHPGILRAKAYTVHERGPALVFDYLPGSQRLDHYLAERGDRLTVDVRLDVLRQVAHALRHAHAKRLYHRALSPQSVLVLDPESPTPRVQVFNWQTAARGPSSSMGTSLGMSYTAHFVDFVEEASAVYVAPEALTQRGEAAEQADVFSLGALAYRLFSGRPPARTYYELTEKLREGKGMQISAVLDGAVASLQDLIRFSTYPEVTARYDSVADFLAQLEKFEDEITTPEPERSLVLDPTAAKPGDRLLHGLTVCKRLGKGACSLALLVEREGKEQVLKVALEPAHNARLQAEAEAVGKLHHQYIVRLREELDFGGRRGLLMDRAGNQTLAQRLREEGRLHLELLERFGGDLLQVVDWLEQEGVPHRDIKPENLGVALMGRAEQLHLVLFDFSLAGTPAESILAGTAPYRDPFLARRRPPRWDTYAERFAAAVTLYQMATGALPVWGDGQSDPAVIDNEVTLDPDAFDPTLREPLAAFFVQALRRDYRQRFDNAQEMLAAWRRVFAGAARAEVGTDHGEERAPVTTFDEATLDSLLPELGLSPRALNAVERANLRTARDLIHYPLAQLRRLRGVGSKTRQELAECMSTLAGRFPAVAAEPKKLPEDAAEAPAGTEEAPSIDMLAGQLVPTARSNEARAKVQAVECLLGLQVEPLAGWPSQSDVARHLSLNPATVSVAIASARQRWLKAPPMTGLREDMAALLESQGGAMTTAELVEALLASRGSLQTEPTRTRQALAVARAAIETERDRAAPRWILRRLARADHVLLARDELASDGTASIDGEKLADYAEALGGCADTLALEDPLRPPGRVLEILQALEPAAGVTRPATNRLLQLAAATSQHAALSSRLELYPRGMPAARALKLALGALAGAKELTPEQVRERVAGRYPEAEPLPERPALDGLLDAAGSELKWEPEARGGKGAYVSPLREFTTLSSATALTRPTTAARRFEQVPADKVEVELFDKRLRYSVEQQHFLILLVAPGRAVQTEHILAARFAVEVRSLDRLLIGHMKVFAADKRIDWRIVLRADAVPAGERDGSRDWANLQRVVRSVLPAVKAELARAERHLLLTNPGLLARYGQMRLLGELLQETGRPGGPPGLWVLVPSDGQQQKPTLDGQPVPVYTSAQWARIPDLWLAVHQEALEPEGAVA